MNNSGVKIPAEYIVPLNMNGLRGRMLKVPANQNKKREFLVVYGHHTSLERMYGFADFLRDYGSVTIPDLPGFGGMDSFYKIHEKPDLDTLADYLASFIKLRFRNKQVTIVGFSTGFLIVTRMLQRYPKLCDQVDILVSLAGFASHEDFVFSKTRKRFYRHVPRLFERRLTAVFFRNVLLHPTLLKLFYKHTYNAREKFDGLDDSNIGSMTKFEIQLWRTNDVRTYMKTTREMFNADNTKQKVPLNVWQVAIPADKYFDEKRTEKHLKMIFKKVTVVKADQKRHMPIVLADKSAAAPYFPPKLLQAFRRQPKH